MKKPTYNLVWIILKWTKRILCKQWKHITPPPLLPPVLHLHQGIAPQCHPKFCLDLPFCKVWLQVSYQQYHQTICGYVLTIHTVHTEWTIIHIILVGELIQIVTLLSLNHFLCSVIDPLPPPSYPRPPPESPHGPRKTRNMNNPTYRHQCLCYDCVHGSGCTLLYFTPVILLSHHLSYDHKLIQGP